LTKRGFCGTISEERSLMNLKWKWKLFILKRKAQRLYKLYRAEKDSYRSAGNHLAEYMNPRLAYFRDECNKVLDEMAKYDGSLGSRRLT
jgi:hypothetical protein